MAWKLVYQFMSESRPGVTHKVEQDGISIRCSCESFVIRQTGNCKHTIEYRKLLKKEKENQKNKVFAVVERIYEYNDETYSNFDPAITVKKVFKSLTRAKQFCKDENEKRNLEVGPDRVYYDDEYWNKSSNDPIKDVEFFRVIPLSLDD